MNTIVEDVRTGKAQLVDVRSKLEWVDGHAQGAAHIPIENLLDGRIEDLETDKVIYVYCASGGRAGTAESYLNNHGFTAINIGGLGDWSQMGGDTE